MPTTMLDNRIYNDSWFFALPKEAKWLFLFLITNNNCNLIGCYEMPLSIMSAYTSLDSEQLQIALELIKDKIVYQHNFVIIKNYGLYNPMRNPKIDISKKKQIAALPKRVRKLFDSLCIPYTQGIDTLQGNGKETDQVRKGIGQEPEYSDELDLDEIDKGIEAMKRAKA